MHSRLPLIVVVVVLALAALAGAGYAVLVLRVQGGCDTRCLTAEELFPYRITAVAGGLVFVWLALVAVNLWRSRR